MSKNQYAHQRGEIQESAIKALVTDPLFKTRVMRNRKGKGSYQRKAKHAGKMFEKPDYKFFDYKNFIIGFFLG